MAVCDKCGLPEDLCVCEEIVKESQVVRVSTSTRRFGKLMTIVEGIDDRDINLKDLTKQLKSECACGGTIKEGHIELQGDHKEKVRNTLRGCGYTVYEHNR